jgi:uncharacterized protein YbaP (TraB family)
MFDFLIRVQIIVISVTMVVVSGLACAQPVFNIKNKQGESKGMLIGVFHSGLQISVTMRTLLAQESASSAGLILEQKPVGGWSTELAKKILDFHGISTSQLIRDVPLSCLLAMEQPISKMSEGHKALFFSSPAAYVLMFAQPKVSNYPLNMQVGSLSVEKWLFDYFDSRSPQSIEFLEDHLDPFKRLKQFSAFELGVIAENHCKLLRSGNLDQRSNMLDFSRILRSYEIADFNQLRSHTIEKFRFAGWSSELVKTQYDDRELDFAIKISSALNRHSGKLVVAVGAAHLGGDSGLVARLMAKGFNLTLCDAAKYTSCSK